MAQQMHEIDYKIFGDDMQFVEIELDPEEAVVAEAGGMMYMDDGVAMETIFGDGRQQSSGFLGRCLALANGYLPVNGCSLPYLSTKGRANDESPLGRHTLGKLSLSIWETLAVNSLLRKIHSSQRQRVSPLALPFRRKLVSVSLAAKGSLCNDCRGMASRLFMPAGQ